MKLQPNQRVMVHDDLLATGGTAEAAAKLISKIGANIAGFSFVISLDFLNGQDKLKAHSEKNCDSCKLLKRRHEFFQATKTKK